MFLYLFLIKKLQFTYVQATGEAFSPQKRNTQHFKFINFFLCLWGHFRPPGSGSGLQIRIRIGTQEPRWIRIRIHNTDFGDPQPYVSPWCRSVGVGACVGRARGGPAPWVWRRARPSWCALGCPPRPQCHRDAAYPCPRGTRPPTCTHWLSPSPEKKPMKHKK